MVCVIGGVILEPDLRSQLDVLALPQASVGGDRQARRAGVASTQRGAKGQRYSSPSTEIT